MPPAVETTSPADGATEVAVDAAISVDFGRPMDPATVNAANFGIACPDAAPLLGFVSLVAPALATGNAVVVVPSEVHPLAATDFYQVLETSDVPAGVVNILTGDPAELTPWLASHLDVNALDLTGVADPALAAELEASASVNLKRVVRPGGPDVDWTADPGLAPLTRLLEIKTIWHPKGW